MGKKDPRIDAYIAKSANFAKPVLRHLRRLVHKACREVEETLKWGHPSFIYKGILCGFAAFKEHCTFGFWKGELIVGISKGRTQEAMGQFGRITALGDLPSDRILITYIKEAVTLHDKGTKLPPRPKKPKQRLIIPTYFMVALKNDKKALATFDGFCYSNKKDYVEWIQDA